MANASIQCVSSTSCRLAEPISSPAVEEVCGGTLHGAAEALPAASDAELIDPPPLTPFSAPSASHDQCTSSVATELREKLNVTLLLSAIAVSCWSLPGNAARVALSNSFVGRHSFYRNYTYFGPNCLGCFLMGLLGQCLPTEPTLPFVYRALCVGFCGSFTTYSSWIVQIMNTDRFATACEVFFSGVTMPFVFYQWGHDMGRLLCCAVGLRRGSVGRDDGVEARQQARAGPIVPNDEVATLARAATEGAAYPSIDTSTMLGTQHGVRCRLYTIIDLVFLTVSLIAAIVIPVVLHTAISRGDLEPLSRGDIYMTVLGPSGACPRYLLATFLNRRVAWVGFPVGTLIANVLATLIAVVLDHYNVTHPVQPAAVSGSWYVIALNGISAALSTVSTFVHEVISFYEGERRYVMAYVYVCVTLLLTMLIGGAGRRHNF